MASVEVQADAPSPPDVQIAADGSTMSPASFEAPPRAVVRVTNAGEARHVKLERLGYASQAATAYEVSLLPEFRQQFAGEVLAAGLALRVTRGALLFSDLSGSTALYSHAGDASAFRIVQDHFTLLIEVIRQHEGTVVKTIGDAIMAAFADEAHLVRAAMAMQAAFVAFREQTGDQVGLKVGGNVGACYAVTANGILDYFGQTVNMAARLQGQAGPGDVVLPLELAERARTEGWLDEATSLAPFEAHLKGIDAPVPAARIRQ